jgi:hypothetical protein
MFSLEFLKNYGARIQLGMQIDNYKKKYKRFENIQFKSGIYPVAMQISIASPLRYKNDERNKS